MPLVDDIGDAVLRKAIEAGLSQDQALEVAREVEREIQAHYGGGEHYVHAPSPSKEAMYTEIRRSNDGTPQTRDRICARLGVSRATFYRALKQG